MRRFFVPSLGAAGATLKLPPSVRRHLAVLRLAPGEHVELFDGSGQQARARLEDDETVTVEALEEAHGLQRHAGTACFVRDRQRHDAALRA